MNAYVNVSSVVLFPKHKTVTIAKPLGIIGFIEYFLILILSNHA